MVYALLSLAAVGFLMPVVWMVATSLKPETQATNPGAIANPIGQPQKKVEPIQKPSGPFVLDFLL